MSCLVTAIADDPEQKHARRWGVHLAVQGWPGTVCGRPDTRQLADRVVLIEKFWRTRAEPPYCAADGLASGGRVQRRFGSSAF
jgi:hypothetical protein